MEEMQNTHEIGREEAGDVRAKFDAISPVEVSSAEVKGIRKGKGFFNRVVNWLQSKRLFGKYVNTETGWDIEFSNASVRSVTSHNARDGKIALIIAVPDLIKSGVYLETIPKNNQGLISHIFAGKATIDSVLYAISYVVREDVNGRRYYDHSLTKIEALDQADDQAPTKEEPKRISAQGTFVSASYGSPELSTANILKMHLGVNTQDKRDGRQKLDVVQTPKLNVRDGSAASAQNVISTHKIPQSPTKVNTLGEKK